MAGFVNNCAEMEVVNDNDGLENPTSVTVNAENITPTSTPEASQASGTSQPSEMSQEASQPSELRRSSCSASARAPPDRCSHSHH